MGEREIARRMLERSGVTETPPAPTPAAPLETTPRPILDDVEAALLAGLCSRGLMPGEAYSRRQLHADPEIELYEDARLEQAAATLAEKGLIVDLGDGRVALTRDGLLQSRRGS